MTTYDRIVEFVNNCSDESISAKVIRDNWISGEISREQAWQISEDIGIAHPLEYWR